MATAKTKVARKAPQSAVAIATKGTSITGEAFIISPQTSDPIIFPIPPDGTEHGGYGATWDQVSRGVGRKPLLLEGPALLKTWSGTLLLATWDPDVSVDPTLIALERLVSSRERVAVHFGRPEQGTWRITSMTYRVIEQGRNAQLEPSRVEVSLSLTEVSDLTLAPTKRGPKTPQIHVVKKGERLTAISVLWYGSTKYAGSIMKAQRPPMKTAQVRVGQRLVIPVL